MVGKSKIKKIFPKTSYIKALKNTLTHFGISNNIGAYSLKDGSINLSEEENGWKVSCIDRNCESYRAFYSDENEACKRVLELYSSSRFKLQILTRYYQKIIQ